MMKKIFISHSSKDDEFVKNLRKALEIQKLGCWVDSRQLTAGDELEPEIKDAIDESRAFILVLSMNTFNSAWVLKETQYALEVKKERGDDYKVIPLMLEGVEPGALNLYFGEEPLGLKVEVRPGGIGEAMAGLLAALGERLPEDAQPMLRPETEPLEELLLELTDPCIVTKGGTRRTRATAQLTYISSEEGNREVRGKRRFLFTARINCI